jgi:hypothetical protein
VRKAVADEQEFDGIVGSLRQRGASGQHQHDGHRGQDNQTNARGAAIPV